MNILAPDMFESRPVRLTVEDYLLLVRSGAFDGLYKVELIEGTIVAMNAEYRLHGVVKNRLVRAIQRALEQIGSELEALNEIAVRMGDDSLPQPDAIVARVTLDRQYFQAGDVAIAIEVVDRSSQLELQRKQALYAAASIPEFWAVSLKSGMVELFWSPVDGVYQQEGWATLVRQVQSATIPDLVVDGTGIL